MSAALLWSRGKPTRIFELVGKDRRAITHHAAATVPAIQLFDLLPEHPIVTLSGAIGLLETSKPTAAKAIDALGCAGVLHETTGKRRDRVYAYRAYLKDPAEDTSGAG